MKRFELVIESSRLEPLRPVLESWCHILKVYIDRVPGDLPFWYLERPQVGFLAAAAWRTSGWAALEEWGIEKGPQHERSQGRNDLWIGRKKNATLSKAEYFIEAKHTQCDIHQGKEHSCERMKKALDAARRSANQLLCKPPETKIAAVFVTPVWKLKSGIAFEKARKEWVAACLGMGVGAVAVFLLAKDDKRQNQKGGEKFIGSALLLNIVK